MLFKWINMKFSIWCFTYFVNRKWPSNWSQQKPDILNCCTKAKFTKFCKAVLVYRIFGTIIVIFFHIPISQNIWNSKLVRPGKRIQRSGDGSFGAKPGRFVQLLLASFHHENGANAGRSSDWFVKMIRLSIFYIDCLIDGWKDRICARQKLHPPRY